ncbi:MAG: Qat anti-phage system QueC-like protein QatC [Desulfobaccales bacterium]
MTVQLYLRVPKELGRPASVAAHLVLSAPGGAGYPLHHNLEEMFASPEPPGAAAVGFLLAALVVWAADKLVVRRAAADAWTRQIVLHLPAPEPWRALAPDLSRVLNFLTGDDWTLKPRGAWRDPGLAMAAWPHPWRPQAVALFSGGLDSLVGAIDLLEAGKRLVLVSHYDFGQLASIQQGLAAALKRHYGPDRVHHLGVRVQFPESPELTLRSRSLLYLALGLATAAAFGGGIPLYLPENGWVSLNPPLTGNRLGSYSTRTTHPQFLSQLDSLWRRAGLDQPLGNPYQGLTKGEMLLNCRNRSLLKELFPRTVSCARPVASRWQGRPAGSCGGCYPCLMRRAALNRLGWDAGGDYLLDVLAEEESLCHRTRGQDLRALLLALKTWEESPAEILARLWLGESPAAAAARGAPAKAVLTRGFQEIGQFFRDKGPEWIKDYGGW